MKSVIILPHVSANKTDRILSIRSNESQCVFLTIDNGKEIAVSIKDLKKVLEMIDNN